MPAKKDATDQRMTESAIRTVAVHLPTAALTSRLLDLAIPLARQHAANLIGVHVHPAVVVYADATVSMSTEFIVAQQEAFREDARAVESAFRARLEGTDVPFEWSALDTGDEPTMRAASTACNVADLVVASQYHESIPAASGYGPDELVLGTGRPVLIVPAGGELKPVGRRVLVAWNGSREASRATFDCLPLLAAEAELRLLTVDSPRGDATLAAITRSLTRHGVDPHPVSVSKSEGRSTAEEILKYAAEFAADLLVIGCFGHSRLRETVFGGATTSILRDMALPVLMAH
jgi:nucleotide-binding universal stress UspA family protein